MGTTKQLAEAIGIEYHGAHFRQDPEYWKAFTDRSWDAFLLCTHEICEDSRELMAYLDTQPTAKWVRKDWEEDAAKQEASP